MIGLNLATLFALLALFVCPIDPGTQRNTVRVGVFFVFIVAALVAFGFGLAEVAREHAGN